MQKQLVPRLEALVSAESASEINLGGILLDRLPECYEGSDDLYAKASAGARLVPLPSTIPGERFRSAGADRADMVIKAGLGPAVVENALKTMIDARQLEYLRLAKIPNAEWKILVEVHYIRSRPKDMAGFHKDTKGETLFVNLNYHVGENKVVGPEYVVNPAPSPAHDAQIFGTTQRAATLPTAFTDDLLTLRGSLGDPAHIRSGVVNPYGYVAFVDEAIHHATPWYGHRFVTGAEFKAYLARAHPAKFTEMVRAIKAFQSSFWSEKLYPFGTYVNTSIVPEGELATWNTWMAMAGDDRLTAQYTREDLVPSMTDDEFDLMLDDVGAQEGAARIKAGSGGWFSARIPDAGLSPVKAATRPPLKRQGSTADFKRDRPKQLPEDIPRRFLRTWVRVIPEAKAAKLRNWARTEGWT